ncbi:hypothetical protein [Sphingomonas sp. 22176]|uniref:hypothetical protein n=1 Tax=Sphingomonas sp. 22176 TaxID=3453884 RepID=UPI003F86CB34
MDGGALVTNSGAPAVTMEVTNGVYYSNYATINVRGQIDGGTQAGIAVRSGTNTNYSGVTARLALSVDQGASISGDSALTLGLSAGNSYGLVVADVDNAGTLSGTSGVALRGDILTQVQYPSSAGGFSSISNRAGGVISGSIVGPVGTLNNAGLIDGGSNSAFTPGAAGVGSPYLIYKGSWTNSGTIQSNSAAATLLSSTIGTLTNSGTIANSGTGPALSGSSMSIQNLAGGLISSAGSIAIVGTGDFRLVNAGTITGDVVTGDSYGLGNTVDSGQGTINGSLLFGAANDTLIARYDAATGTVITGVTGSISAGGGTNTERVKFASDSTIGSAFAPLAGFQQLVIDPAATATVTLSPSYSTTLGLVLSGSGTVVNKGTIATSGTAVTDLNYSFGSAATFQNEGTINATASTYQAGISLSNDRFVNKGSVTVAGGIGVSMSYNDLENSGTIAASGTGVTMFDAVLNNSGTILSTGSAGVSLSGNVGYTGSNSGTITGATAGAITDIYLTNTGTISSAGVGVQVQPYGYLINAAGGVVNGGSGGAVTVNSFNAGIANAGTINGNVAFTAYGSSNNLAYIAVSGGVLNGNLQLGGATLVTDIANTGNGTFAGITGTVTAGSGASLRYVVNTDTSTTLSAAGVGPFSNVGYQLANGAQLTLTASSGQTLTAPVQLAGTGSVDLDAGITTTDAAALQNGSVITYPGSGIDSGAAALSITSRGAISVTRSTGPNSYNESSAVWLGYQDSFTNLGTINVTDRNTSAYLAGISGGGTITNAGTILLDGGIGIRGTAFTSQIANTGTIGQRTGGAASIGLTGSFTLDNSGSISVAGTAIAANGDVKLVNSGAITSTAGIAITGSSYGYATQITNATGGTITGTGGTAVQLSSGVFTNAGTVNGSIDLGYVVPYYSGAPTRSYASSVYVAAGGTVAGDLRFGDGNDLLLQTGDALGVSGTIDGGAGRNVYGRSLSSTGTVALGLGGVVNFQDMLVQATGADTVVTTNGTFAGSVYATGSGSLVNQATLAGGLTAGTPPIYTYLPNGATLFPADQVLTSLTNAGTVVGVSGTVGAFTNSGTIGASGSNVLFSAAVSLHNDTALAFTNSGAINPGATPTQYFSGVALDAGSNLTIANSGSILGGTSAVVRAFNAQAASVSLTNTGTLASTGWAPAVSVGIGTVASGSVTIDNRGTITATNANGSASGLDLYREYYTASATYAVTNSGTISASATTATTVPGGMAAEAYGLTIGGEGFAGTVVNAAGATISAQADMAIGVFGYRSALNLTNAGAISAVGKSVSLAISGDDFDNRVTNTGTIHGDIVFGAGADIMTNAGAINGAVVLGDGDDRFVQNGGGSVTGAIDGGAGNNSFTVSGGSEAAPAVFSDIRNFQRFGQSAGFARIGGTAVFGAIDMTGGRLVGQAGSVITAPQINVGQGATFGSAGVVNGNITVAGTLSPGASPGTMTVNGNVALGSTSTALFELSNAAIDRLVVNGTLSIAPGATLQLVRIGALRQGNFYTLFSATGGVTGSFSQVLQPSDPLGILVVRGGEIGVIGAFRAPDEASAQARGSIAYLNATLAVQPANSALFGTFATLANADDTANVRTFARLTPQPYAAAVQMHVDNALAVVDATRGAGFAATGDVPHAFTFGATMGDWHRLNEDSASGGVATRTQSYGLLGGVGYGNAAWSVGAFGGYINNHQYLDGLAARTRADGAVAGVQARVQLAGFALGGAVAYNSGQATTSRTLPVGAVTGRYDLHSWVFDASVKREYAVPGGWALQPQLGISYVRSKRDRVVEAGGSPFALTVGRDRHVAGFGDAAVSFGRSAASVAAFRPFVSFGMRYQLQGRRTDALASYGGGALGLSGYSASRARLVGTAAGGVSYRLQHGIDLFATASAQTGTDDHREAVSGGVRFRF